MSKRDKQKQQEQAQQQKHKDQTEQQVELNQQQEQHQEPNREQQEQQEQSQPQEQHQNLPELHPTHHPQLFERTITTECSLCHGHWQDGTPYLKMEKDGIARLESWDGQTVVLCGKCVDKMHEELKREA